MVDVARAARLAGRIQQIVASALRAGVKDPRLGMVTVTAVKVTPDLHDATVYYTVLGDETERESSRLALESARGVLRAQVGRQTGVKFTPTLAFVQDAVPETAQHIEELLARAREADEQVHAAAAAATYAGDPDPYRPDNDTDDDDDDDDIDTADNDSIDNDIDTGAIASGPGPTGPTGRVARDE